MNSAIAPGGSSASGYSGLARLIADSASVRRRFDGLTAQISSGLIANTYAGLGGTPAAVSLSLSPRIASLQTWQKNIDAAGGRAQVTQTALGQIQSIAAKLSSQLTSLNGLSPANIDAVAANARGSLAEVGNLLNSQFGDAYVFAGEDTANPPVPNADQITTSGFYTQINAAVGALAANGGAATAAATLTAGGSNVPGTSPFSAFLSQPAAALSPPAVSTGPGQASPLGLVASANTNVPSSGPSTTGSYMRDLMRALATIGSLSSSQANDPGFQDLVSDTRVSMSGVIATMATDAGVLGEKQSSLLSEKTRMQDTAAALTTQVSNAGDVDMAAAISALTQTQTQLQASYQLISTSNAMSLVKFLPSG